MGFNWSLDNQDDETLNALGFGETASEIERLDSTVVVEPAALRPVEPQVVVPVQQPVVPHYAATPHAQATPSRRELRMAALAKPQASAPFISTETLVRNDSIQVPALRRPAASSARPQQQSLRRRVLPKLLSLLAMVGAGALLISTSLPANALMASNADGELNAVSTSKSQPAQSLAAVNANAVAQTSARDKYTVVTLAERYAIQFSSTNWSYTNDPNGTIQWPFPVQVPIATGFGPRQVAGCSFCSTFHEGVDFDPGMGAPIGAIADGVVSDVVNSHAGLGNHVVIDHVINGQQVQSVYAHMLDGSIKVAIGDHVKVAQIIGLVGSTGESTGAHLHLEIHVNNVPIDPFAWLKANAN
jgi:murein DD-endopeptidase MepM/ murein hydrolase activator NlpD